MFTGSCIVTYEFLNVTNEMQLLETLLLLSLLLISCTYSSRMLLMMGEKCPKHVQQ